MIEKDHLGDWSPEKESKLTRLQHAAHKKRSKTDKNWVRHISSRPLDEKEILYSVTDLNILLHLNICRPTILHRLFESVYARKRELRELTKDNIRSRIAVTLQSASLTDCNLTKDELHALKRLKNDWDIAILLADKGRVTVAIYRRNALTS